MRIHWAREMIELNRLDFARKLGVDVSTIRNIETGKANPWHSTGARGYSTPYASLWTMSWRESTLVALILIWLQRWLRITRN